MYGECVLLGVSKAYEASVSGAELYVDDGEVECGHDDDDDVCVAMGVPREMAREGNETLMFVSALDDGGEESDEDKFVADDEGRTNILPRSQRWYSHAL